MAGHEGSLLKHVLRDHALVGAALAVACLKVWSPLYCLVFWLSTILIDIDHYFNLVYWSGFQALRPHQTFHFSAHIVAHKFRQPFIAIEAFHTAEAVLAAAFCGYGLGVGIFRPLLWGMLLHVLVDVVYLSRHATLRLRCHSFVEFWLRKRRIESRGASATRLQREAAQAALRCCDGWGRWL